MGFRYWQIDTRWREKLKENSITLAWTCLSFTSCAANYFEDSTLQEKWLRLRRLIMKMKAGSHVFRHNLCTRAYSIGEFEVGRLPSVCLSNKETKKFSQKAHRPGKKKPIWWERGQMADGKNKQTPWTLDSKDSGGRKMANGRGRGKGHTTYTSIKAYIYSTYHIWSIDVGIIEWTKGNGAHGRPATGPHGIWMHLEHLHINIPRWNWDGCRMWTWKSDPREATIYLLYSCFPYFDQKMCLCFFSVIAFRA